MHVTPSTAAAPTRLGFLLVTVGDRVCALPLQHVWETMRPLPVEPVAGAPAYVLGLSVIRGAPVPVVDAAALLTGAAGAAPCTRFVTVKADERRFALAVDRVVGIRDLDLRQLEKLPALFRHADIDLIEAVGVAEAQLLVVLRSARLVPAETWAVIDAGTEAT